MKNLKNKRGISLIVLVITIIVMIILATAIILSLNNSGIIGKANKAKNDSDTATLKEYVNTLKLDWEFMTAEEKEEYGTTTFIDYANKKIMESGYKDVALDVNGELHLGLTENVRGAIVAGIKIGDEVTGYNAFLEAKTEEEKSYTTDGSEVSLNGEKDSSLIQTVVTNTGMTWRYAGVSEDGNVMILPDLSSELASKYTIKLTYVNGSIVLDDVCSVLYSTSKGDARSINKNDVLNLLGYKCNKYMYVWGEPMDNEAEGGPGYVLYDEYTEAPLNIAELALSKFNYVFSEETVSPEGKYVGEYLSNAIAIYYRDMEDGAGKQLVATDYSYYLADKCSQVTFHPFAGAYVDFGLLSYAKYFGSSPGGNIRMETSTFRGLALRPIVTLNADVELVAPETSDGAWTIK